MKIKICFVIFLLLAPVIHSTNVMAFMFWNQAGIFDGSQSGYISFPNSASLDISSSFSIEGWINPSNSISPAFQIIAEKKRVRSQWLYLIFKQWKSCNKNKLQHAFNREYYSCKQCMDTCCRGL